MPRYIHPDLLDDLKQDAGTFCYLLRIDPVTPGYASYGVTTLNVDVPYDDGLGPLEYSAAIGFQPTSLQGRGNLTVDNADVESLMPEFDVPVDEADIRAGIYDFARFRLYLINYEIPTTGRHALLKAGTIGRVTIDADGLSFVNELRGIVAQLKQSICEKDSLSCRAVFGSQPIGTGGGVVEQRFPCGFDVSTITVASTVDSVGLENTLTFTIAGFAGAADDLNPGVVKFTSGLNAGRFYEIDTNTAGGEVTLAYETDFPIAPGDGIEYRPDCSKLARDQEKGCKFWFGAEWVNHFRGEPDIPIGDAGVMETPGAGASPGQGGTTFEPLPTEPE